MADNFVTNAGSGGDTFGADDIGGVKYARTKIIIGADGTNDGDVSSANPLPVSGTIALGATDNAVLDSIAALLGTIDADTSNITACNTGAVVVASGTITSITNPVAVTGTFYQATQPVSIATAVPVTDNSGSLTVDDGGSSLTVDGTVAVSGSVAVTGTFWQATQPVSGTITANLSATDNAVLDDIAAKLATIDADTSNITACNTGAVVIASGTVTTVSAVTAITNALPAGTNTIGGVISQPSTTAAYDGTTACTIKRLSGIATASGANTIIAAVADKKIRVLALSLLATSTTAVVAYLYNGDYMLLGDGTNKLTLDMDGVGGPAGLVMPFNQGGWLETDTANEALAINLGGATPVIWAITYMEVT